MAANFNKIKDRPLNLHGGGRGAMTRIFFSKTEYGGIMNFAENNMAMKGTHIITVHILPIKSNDVSVIFGKQIMWVDDVWQKK